MKEKEKKKNASTVAAANSKRLEIAQMSISRGYTAVRKLRGHGRRQSNVLLRNHLQDDYSI